MEKAGHRRALCLGRPLRSHSHSASERLPSTLYFVPYSIDGIPLEYGIAPWVMLLSATNRDTDGDDRIISHPDWWTALFHCLFLQCHADMLEMKKNMCLVAALQISWPTVSVVIGNLPTTGSRVTTTMFVHSMFVFSTRGNLAREGEPGCVKRKMSCQLRPFFSRRL